MHHPPTPPDPPGADSGATSPDPEPQTAEAGTRVGTGLPADVQRRWWRARLACGHDVDVTDASGISPAVPPKTIVCPRCGVRHRPEVYPLTALSDPENVRWVPVEDEDDAFTQWHPCEVELWEGEYDR